MRLENAVLLPHLGSATTDTRTAMADLAVRNVPRGVEVAGTRLGADGRAPALAGDDQGGAVAVVVGTENQHE